MTLPDSLHRVRAVILVATVLLLAPTLIPSEAAAVAPVVIGGDDEYVPGELLVGFTAGRPPSEASRRGLGATLIRTFSEIGVEHWRLPPGLSVGDAIRALSGNPAIRFAEPNYIVHAALIPWDDLRNLQWGMHNLGQTGGTADADIDALEAWDVRTDATGIVVGIIDTGIDYTHADLVGNIWTNPGEDLNGNRFVDPTDFDGLDTDGNGKIDDLRGWDCRNEDNDPIDDHNHGTHVAGTVGARANSIGVVGVTWNVKLMPLKFLSASGSGTTADAIECINYAASFVDSSGKKVVRITSNSWGGGRRSTALQDAIAASGALFVAAAGNSGSSSKMYPAGYDLDNIISVAATDHNDALASFSNFGSWVDLGGPGVGIESTIRNQAWSSFSGTSMATPHVSGAAALVMAQLPAMSNLDVTAQLMNTVDILPSLQGKVVSNGRLNVARAIGGTPDPSDPTPPAAVTDLAVDPASVTTSSVTLTWTQTGDDGTVGTAYLYDFRFATTPITEATWASATKTSSLWPFPIESGRREALTVAGLEPSTTYYFAIRMVDEAGNPSSLSNVPSGTTATPPPGSWVLSRVDATGNVGVGTSIDLDAFGNPHIAYRDATNTDLKYARQSGGTWLVETVPDPEGNVGCYPSLVLDASDRPRIAYGGGCSLYSWLKYAQWTGSAWSTETVDQTAKGVGWDVSLALGPTDLPHIAHYKQWGQNALRYARWTGSQWAKGGVEQGSGVGRGTSIAVDGSGNAHITYTVPGEVRYARWTGSAWEIRVVGAGGGATALALDAAGNPRVVFTAPNGELIFARWTGSSWSSQVVDAKGSAGHGALRLDAAGNPRIAYYDTANRDLKYARWDGTTWVIQVVDFEGDVGAYPSLALDAAGTPHISYYDGTSGDLKYARIQR